MPARRATSSMVSSCTGVVGSSSSPICTSWARRSSAVRRRRAGSGAGEAVTAVMRRRSAVAAVSSRSIASTTSCGRSWVSMCPVRSTTCSVASGSASASWRLCRFGVSLSLSPTRISTGTSVSAVELLALVVLAQRRVEGGERPHRRGVHDLGPGHDHLVGGVGAVEQLADHLLVARVRRRQQLPEPLEDPGAADGRGQHARARASAAAARRASARLGVRGHRPTSTPGRRRGPGRRTAPGAPRPGT